MDNTLNVFKEHKSDALKFLERIDLFLQLGEETGANIEPSIKQKLKTAIRSVTDNKLKIALIGGYSEGKTSIAAAWMERIDGERMNISHEESSNEVAIYDIDNEVQLIDTPGLFGFKEKFNPDSAQIEKYKDITKKYVSEAHLVIYVMNSTNPIKESHKDDLVWLFRSLNLLSRTVFVLSRFDEVADVEDAWEYAENLKVKQSNVIERLRDNIQLSEEEAASLSIVAVAANPFDKGTDYWLQNIDKFKAISHIHTLQNATEEMIKASGGRWQVAEEARNSVIRDVLIKELPLAIERDEQIATEVDKLTEVVNTATAQLDASGRRIVDARAAIRDFVSDYFSDLILQLVGTDMETFATFFEREIGDEGTVLNARLQSEFDRQLRSATLELKSLRMGFHQDINHFNETMKGFGKQGINYVVKSKVINNTAILTARDGVVNAAKVIGVDIGGLLKFKPFGAIKAANALNGVLAAAGVLIEVWDSYQEAKRKQEFKKAIDKMKDDLGKNRKELLELINGNQFEVIFFEDFVSLKQELLELKETLNERSEQRLKFHEWRKMGEEIREEFSAPRV